MTKYTDAQLESMNKGQLREACRANGISYNGLNNDGMKKALATVPGEDVEAGNANQPGNEGAADFGPMGEVHAVPVAADAVVPEELRTAAEPVTPAVVVVREPRVLPTLAPVAPVAPKPVKERKIQANRPEQHGVKRPSEGTICAQIWTWCDEVHKAGDKVTAKELKKALADLDDTTKTVQFYRWRKFNGIVGRS